MNTSDPEIKSLLDELATLRATAARRLELLKRCEWSWCSDDEAEWGCPICEEYKQDGHTPACPLASELSGTTEAFT